MVTYVRGERRSNRPSFKKETSRSEKVWYITCIVFLCVSIMLIAVFASIAVGILPISYYEGMVFSIGPFFFSIYFCAVLIFKKNRNRIYEVLSPRWRKVVTAFNSWFSLFGFLVFICLIVWSILNGTPNQGSLVGIAIPLIGGFSVLALILPLPLYPLAIYIPTSKYLLSTQTKEEERKKVADSLTFLTPILGFPFLLTTYFVLFFANIQVEPYWINYIVLVSFYIVVFVLFIELPYSLGMLEKKKQELERLEKKRVTLLEDSQKVVDSETNALLKKIAYEIEIARIDREKLEIKSRSVHRYKLIIPPASFFLGITSALFIEFIKSFL